MRGIAAFFLWNPFCCWIPLLVPFLPWNPFLQADSPAAAFFKLRDPFLLVDSLAGAFFAVKSFLLLDSLAAASCFESFFPYRFKTEMKGPQLISSKSICLEVRNFCRLLSQSVSALLSRVKDL